MSVVLKASNPRVSTTFCTQMITNQPDSTVLAWLQLQLSIYIELNLINFIPDLSNINYWLGKPIFCLAHHFFPDAFYNQDFIAQLDSITSTADSKAISLFENRLNVTVHNDLETYFTDIQLAIQQQMTTDATLRELFIGLTEDNNTVKQEGDLKLVKQEIDQLLIPITKLYYQCIDLVKNDASSATTRSPSPRINMDDIHHAVEDLQLPIQSRLLRQQSQTQDTLSLEDIESEFYHLDSQLKSLLQDHIHSLPLEVQSHPDLATHISQLDATHAALQFQLNKGLRNAIGIEFSTTTAYIRNELEFIQAKMLKTTTTDTGIHDLEVRSTKVGTLIEKLNHRYPDRDVIQQQQYEALSEKYQLIIAWVDEVRVWFVEAERIRLWIEERIQKLESRPATNALDDVEFDYTQEQIDTWNDEHEKLEKQVENFDAQDMTRLRAHVKALTSGHNKDLSPADTTTIEITFTTLMTLDRLMHLLRRHGYELQMLTLRMAWEQSYLVTVSWVRTMAQEVKQFVQNKARWRPSNSEPDKSEIIAALIQFEQHISNFDQGQFTATVNCYQDLDDTCHIELPTHLESRQVAIEEAFEELTHRIAFARQVVEQYLIVSDLTSKTDQLKYEGELLRQEMAAAELTPITDAVEFSERVTQFQDDAVRLVTGIASRVPYPEASHPADQHGNEESNETIRKMVGARKSALILFGEALDQGLNSLRRAIQLQKRAKQLEDEMSRLTIWVDERVKAMEKSSLDALVAGKCALDDNDMIRLKKERDGQLLKLNGIKENELMKLKENIQSLFQSCTAYHPNNIHISAQIDQLNKNTTDLEGQIEALEESLQVRGTRLDVLEQRILWETKYTKANQWISNTTFEVWDFVMREAQWRTATTIDEDRNEWKWFLKQEWTGLDNKVKEFYAIQLKSVCDTFIELKDGFDSPAILQMTENQSSEESAAFITSEHLQHRQDLLIQSYNNLHDVLCYSEQVIDQHTALTEFTTKVQYLQSNGQQLIYTIQNTIANIMTLDKQNEYQQIVNKITCFGQDVIQLWVETGSQLPYPQCPEDARATRPSTNDDEISTEIANTIYKMYSELQDQVKKLSEYVQTLDVSMVHRSKIETWCNETQNATETIKALKQDALAYEFDLGTSTVHYDGQSIKLDDCQQKQQSFTLQLEQFKSDTFDPLHKQLTCLHDTSLTNTCNTVDITITQEPWSTLERSWDELALAVQQYSQRLSVCEARQNWYAIWLDQHKLLRQLEDDVREWNNKKILWASKYDGENCDLGQQELSFLVNQCESLNHALENYVQQVQPDLIASHKVLSTVFYAINIPDDSNILGANEQNEVEKLFTRLQDVFASQLSEISQVQARYEWESRVDNAVKLCQDKEAESEHFIQTNARWSPSSTKIDVEKLQQLHQSAADNIKIIDTLLNEQTTTSTESVFRRKAKLEALKGRLEQHDEFLDQVVEQHQVLCSLLTELEEMESKAEVTKSQFLSLESPLVQELLDHKQNVVNICNSVDEKMVYPVRHYRDHDPSAREKDVAHNKLIQEMIKVRQTHLIETGNTLESILKSKERLSRRKAAENSYLTEASPVEGWIENQFKQLNQPTNNESIECLKQSVALVNGLQSAISTYTSVHSLEVAANKYITLIQQQQGDDDSEEVLNSVNLIKSKQQSVMDAWQNLSTQVAQAQTELSFELRKAEFFDLVSAFKTQFEALQTCVASTNVADVTEDVASQWQNEIQTIETKTVEHIKSKVESAWETDLQDVLNQFNALKAQVQESVQKGNHYRLKQSFFEGADNLNKIMSNMTESLNNLSKDPIIIKGNLEEDDLLVKQVTASFSDICDNLDHDQETYDEQRSFYRFLQLNKVPDLENVDERQQTLEKQWKQLKSDISNHKQQYVTPMSQWLELHNKLHGIREESLNGILDRLENFEHLENSDGSIPGFLDQDSSLLNLLRHRTTACLDIAVTLPKNEDNLACFKNKYQDLMSDIKEAENILVEKKMLAQQQVDVLSCQAIVENVCEKIMNQIELIENERIGTVDSNDNLENLYKEAVKAHVNRESIQQTLNNEVMAIKQRIDSIQEKYGKIDDLSLLHDQLNQTKKNFEGTMKESHLMNDFVRRVLGHNKTASNIQSWLDNCQTAIANIDTTNKQLDESAATLEISSLSQKLNDFSKVIKQFQDLSNDITNTPASDQTEGLQKLSINIVDAVIKPKLENITEKWNSTNQNLTVAQTKVEKIAKDMNIARKLKHLTSLINETKGYLNEVSLFDFDDDVVSDDDKTQVEDEEKDNTVIKIQVDSCEDQDLTIIESKDNYNNRKLEQDYLKTMPRQNQLKDMQYNLKKLESDMLPQIDEEIKSLNAYISNIDIDQEVTKQQEELDDLVSYLKETFKIKNSHLEKSIAIGSYLNVVDNIDILQTSLEDAINQSVPHHSTIIGTLSRTDLHAKLIELDARFKYYELKITQNLEEAEQKVDSVKKVSAKGGPIVEDHYKEMVKKWASIKKQFKTKKIELSRSIDTSSDSKDQRIRKSSLPTRKASSLLRDRADATLAKQRLSPTASSTSSSSSSSRTTNTSKLPQARLMTPLPHKPSKSLNNLKSKPRTSTSTAIKPPLNSYVADPHNDLDIEIGRIVNETPYRVKVKMVPGEVGRYWFGNLNPKLCYCRVLKSKMVMVRVGGGWTELSQFLRDHALLEGDFIPRNNASNTLHKKNSANNVIPEEDEEPKSPTIQEGFIETHRAQNFDLMSSNSLHLPRRPNATTRPVTGSPSHSATTQAGYKEGNKFFAVDSYGNQHEVHMRRAPNDIMSRSNSSTTNTMTTDNITHLNDYTKKRIARKEKKKPTLIPNTIV